VPINPSDLYAGYQRASRVAPIDRASLTTAFRPYGILFSHLKGKTDQQLRSTAVSRVLQRWRRRRGLV